MSIRPKQQGGFQGGLSGTTPGPQRAKSRTTTQRARTLRVAAGSGHIGNLHSTAPVLLGVLPALRIHADNPERPALPLILVTGAVHVPGPRRPSSIANAAARTHAHAAQRRTLSFTIASQTIASSPDGSVMSSSASWSCGTPAATVGGGCRFRASSTVTSRSRSCTNT